MKVTVRPSGQVGAFPSTSPPNCNATAVWIGSTDSFDSVSTYQIHTHDNAHDESFITSRDATETVKKVDIFSKARHKDVLKHTATLQSGFIIDSNNVNANQDIRYTIPIKIDPRCFLVLDSIRYLPVRW